MRQDRPEPTAARMNGKGHQVLAEGDRLSHSESPQEMLGASALAGAGRCSRTAGRGREGSRGLVPVMRMDWPSSATERSTAGSRGLTAFGSRTSLGLPELRSRSLFRYRLGQGRL